MQLVLLFRAYRYNGLFGIGHVDYNYLLAFVGHALSVEREIGNRVYTRLFEFESIARLYLCRRAVGLFNGNRFRYRVFAVNRGDNRNAFALGVSFFVFAAKFYRYRLYRFLAFYFELFLDPVSVQADGGNGNRIHPERIEIAYGAPAVESDFGSSSVGSGQSQF